MEDYLHQEVELDADEVVEVILDHPANVMLLKPAEFTEYRNRKPFRYTAGVYYKETPARIPAPYPGPWHVVVDLGGGAGRVRASLRVLPNAMIS
jgi:Domain of unknown function (DUF1883)